MAQSAGDILAGVKQSVQEDDAKGRLATQTSTTPVPSGLAPEHEYSRASYTMAHPTANKPDLKDEARSAGEGIKARQEMEKKALQ